MLMICYGYVCYVYFLLGFLSVCLCLVMFMFCHVYVMLCLCFVMLMFCYVYVLLCYVLCVVYLTLQTFSALGPERNKG